MAEIKIKIKSDCSCQNLMDTAEDIGKLVELIPEWQRYEAEEITDRILGRFKGMLKTEQNK